jgi:hypothetical protein
MEENVGGRFFDLVAKLAKATILQNLFSQAYLSAKQDFEWSTNVKKIALLELPKASTPR